MSCLRQGCGHRSAIQLVENPSAQAEARTPYLTGISLWTFTFDTIRRCLFVYVCNCTNIYIIYIYISVCDIYIYACVHVCMYACVHVCMYACMYAYIMRVCMYACMNIWMYECMNVRMYACMHVWMYEYMNIWMYECMNVCMNVCMNEWVCECMYVCMYVCMHVCMYVCTFVYCKGMYAHTWTNIYK